MKPALPAILALAILTLPAVEARTWTSADGKKIEAEFIVSDGKKVTIRRSDGRKFTLPLEKISDADRDFVAKMLEEIAAGEKENRQPKATGEIKSPEDGSKVKRELAVRGRTEGAPKGYVAMAFRREVKKDYLLPNIEYSRANKTFSTTLYHGKHELGEWAVHLCVLPEEDAKELSAWMKNVVSLYEKGEQDKVKPYDAKLINKSIEVATARYFLRTN